MRNHLLVTVLLAVCSAIVPLGQAQDDPNLEIGLKPFGSFHGGDLDSVSMTNGNLTLHIPLWSFPQRGGVRLNFSILYNDKQWQIHTQCLGINGCIDTWRVVGQGIEVVQDQGITVSSRVVTLANHGSVTLYTAKTVDGASHQLANVSGAGSDVYESIDASGIRTDSAGVHDRSGVLYGSTLSFLLKDLNGNEVLPASGGGSTDTVGRTVQAAPKLSFSGGDMSKCQGLPLPTTDAAPWTIPAYGGGTTTLTFCFAQVHFYHASDGNGPDFNFDYKLIQAIVLPNGTSWIFQYQPNEGNLTKVTFPTGGSISYTWLTGQTACSSSLGYSDFVSSRTVDANDGSGGHTWNYTWGTGGTRTNKVRDPLGNDTVYTVTGLGGSCSFYETQLDQYQGSSGGTPLKTVKTDYTYSSNPFDTYNGNIPTKVNVVPIRVTTIWPGGKQSKVETDYDSGFSFGGTPGTFGVVTAKRQYDYGQGTPTRQTLNTYVWQAGSPNYQNYLTANLLDLPVSQIVNNGSGYKCAETDYAYDDGSRLSTPVPPVTTQHVAAPLSVRGNLSSVTRKLSTTPCQGGGTWTPVPSYMNTYDTGMAYQAIDALGHTTTYTYDPAFSGAYRTQTQLPDTTTPGLAHHSVSGWYDLNSGLLTSFTDQNGNQSTYSYDNMLRFTQAIFPQQTVNGVAMNGETDFYYPDAVTVERRDKIDSSQWADLYVRFDGLGREIRRIKANGESTPWDQTDTCYDARGSVSFTSSPYQGSGLGGAQVCSGAGDAFSYDALKRTINVTHADNSTVLTSYTAAATSVSDEGNGTRRVQRISQTDGLGRLLSVCEVTSTTLAFGIAGSTAPASCGQDISATGFLTSYLYDGLDNLTRVTQGPLNLRTFSYDSFSRLTSATNPESGTVSYGYDNDGNLLQRTQPAPNQTGSDVTVTATMQYDALHRMYSKTYSDSTSPVTINYDESAALGISLTSTTGRKSSEFTGPSGSKISGSVFSYDSLGRVLNNSQCTPQNCASGTFAVTYAYDLLGSVLASTNGKGVTLTYGYNVAERPTSLTSSLANSQHPGTLFSGALYNAFGMNTAATLGDNNLGHVSIAETQTMVTTGTGANRGWLASHSVGTSGSIYSLSMSSYAPNGDVLSANDSINGNWSYGYDDFNRLTSSSKTGASYTYLYDRFGNRWQQNGPYTSVQSFDANNHNFPTDGVTFDAAGNVKTYNNGSHTYSYAYDAENRLSTVDTTAGVYSYDAEGRRIRRVVSGAVSDYLYDLGGHVMTEVSSTGTWTHGEVFLGGRHLATFAGGAGGTTNFAFTDWLGTERARTQVNGTRCETIVSLPFGDGQVATGSCDPTPLHFTGKERDSESGLDNFGARYHASTMGRFMSPDPKMPSLKHLLNPQKWNKYAYTLNNPLRYVDPDGLEEMDIQVRAFISQQSVSVAGQHFAGDNRGFSTAANASSRTSITVRIETDASKRANPIISTSTSIGQSQKLDANGNVIKTGTANTGLPTVNGGRDANGNVVLNFQQDTKNPLSPGPQALTPGISTDLTVTVPQSGSSVTAAGTTSGFPSIEMNVTPDGQPTSNVPLNDPGPNGSALQLFNTNNVLVTQPLPPPPPPCATDKNQSCSH